MHTIDHTIPEVERACEIILQVTKPGCLHRISAIRSNLHEITRAAQDAALLTLAKAGHISLHRIPNVANVTESDREAAFLAAGVFPRHYAGRLSTPGAKSPHVAYMGRYHGDLGDSSYKVVEVG